MSSMIAFAPVLGSANIPMTTKAGLALLLSMIVFPLASKSFPVLPEDVMMFTFVIVREVMVGVLIGAVGTLMFSSIQLAGQIYGMQMGFGIVNVMDPMSDEQISILGQFQFVIAILIFFTIDGHHVLLRLIMESYNVLPMGQFGLHMPMYNEIIHWLQKMMVIAFKVGMPMIFTLLLLTVSLGIIARTVPQMNVFIVGLPMQIFIGLFIMCASLYLISGVLQGFFNMMFTDIYKLLRMAAGSG